MHPLIIFGLIFNSACITLNRFWKPFPDWLYLPCLILGIACIIAGAILTKRA